MHLKGLLKNKILIYKNFNGIGGDATIDAWPYWLLEENIKIMNELSEDEDKEKKKQEGDQSKQMGNFSPNSYMKGMDSMSSKFKK